MHAVLADTGPLYEAVDPRDEFHGQAIREMEKLARAKRRIVVAYPILLEAHNMVLHRFGRSTAMDWLTDMTSTALVNPTPADYELAVAKMEALGDQAINLIRRDCGGAGQASQAGSLDLRSSLRCNAGSRVAMNQNLLNDGIDG